MTQLLHDEDLGLRMAMCETLLVQSKNIELFNNLFK